jgi:hypothetical protein
MRPRGPVPLHVEQGLSLASAVASSRYDQCASLGKKEPRSNEGATAPELCKISPANFGDLCKTEVQLLRILLPGTGVKIALAAAPFSWLRGGPPRAMVHLGEAEG